MEFGKLARQIPLLLVSPALAVSFPDRLAGSLISANSSFASAAGGE